MNHAELLAYYREPGAFTAIDGFDAQVDALPDDIGTMAHAVQMLLVHRWWAQAYGVEVTPECELENGLHSTTAMLRKAMSKAETPIGGVRLPDKRVVGVCRHFSVMMAAFMKRKGYAARARCGFATYFEPGKHVDHWVAEYWNAGESRWMQVDAQLDSLQVQAKNIEFDPLDVPRDRFLVAGDAWLQHRAGAIDAATCGILDMWGEWYIAGNLALDMASLQRAELLPWEPWGMLGVPDGPGAAPAAAGDANHALVDDIAGWTLAADAPAVGKLLAMARDDVRVRPNAKTIEAALAADAVGTGTGANPLASR